MVEEVKTGFGDLGETLYRLSSDELHLLYKLKGFSTDENKLMDSVMALITGHRLQGYETRALTSITQAYVDARMRPGESDFLLPVLTEPRALDAIVDLNTKVTNEGGTISDVVAAIETAGSIGPVTRGNEIPPEYSGKRSPKGKSAGDLLSMAQMMYGPDEALQILEDALYGRTGTSTP
ncbi:hypothetical protein GF327_03920, partial [Candidatus Woesearchaeota archaeon]|nr:hypothetical protein [Candidatus Woesearchaeota archaeon]